MAHWYLFVDGNYLDRAYRGLLTEFMVIGARRSDS
jgi:hypothetical protein